MARKKLCWKKIYPSEISDLIYILERVPVLVGLGISGQYLHCMIERIECTNTVTWSAPGTGCKPKKEVVRIYLKDDQTGCHYQVHSFDRLDQFFIDFREDNKELCNVLLANFHDLPF